MRISVANTRAWLLCSALGALSDDASAQPPAYAADASRPPEARWSLHVLFRPGSQDARVSVGAEEGVVPVRLPWECTYRRTTVEQEDLVKVKCAHTSGAVVGTVATCRREPGQADLAQLNIGVDGVAAYETIDLSCFVPGPGDPGRAAPPDGLRR